MVHNLKSVSQLAEETPFTEAQIRWWVFNERMNGLADCGAIVRIGRRVYIDTDGLNRWVEKQNPAEIHVGERA
ncbi:hypothetical protein GCM10027431_09590 [Lysobacter rhizosphaerae]